MRPSLAPRRPVRALAAALVVAVGLVGVAPGPVPGAAAAATPAWPSGGAGPGTTGRVVVSLEPGAAVAVAAGWQPVAPGQWVVDVEGDPEVAARRWAAQPGVAWAEPDTLVAAAVRPDDPLLDQQAQWQAVRAEEAWAVTTGDASVVVAVLDTGVDPTHPDLAGKLVPGGDFVTVPCADGRGSASHGTVVAGLVGASTDNGVGVAGLGWDVGIMSLRVLCDNGIGSVADVAAAIRFAVDHGAEILNLSLTGTTDAQVIDDAVAYAAAHGALVVAAAGNSASTTPVFPAALPGVLAVGASSGTGLAGFSNRGSWVDLVAPGVDLYSTVPGGSYGGGWTGTSFSAPLVAATAALLRSRFPDITAAGVAERLARSSLPLSGPTGGVQWGRLDAGAALGGGFAGLWWVDGAGGVAPLGDATGWGSLAGVATTAPVRAMAVDGHGRGYWLVGADGGVFTFGDAGFFGSLGDVVLGSPVVGVAATPSGEGYWLVGADGGVFTFGDAGFFGSLGDVVLGSPVVGVAATPSGEGYWLVGADGGVFTFGDAGFFGSLGDVVLGSPVVGVAATPSGEGYWLVGADGGVFTFGAATFHGAATGTTSPTIGLVVAAAGAGYWVVTADGTTLALGAAPALRAAAVPPVAPLVGVGGLVGALAAVP